MTVRIHATFGSLAVDSDGTTLAHAVRNAVHRLGIGPGRTIGKPELLRPDVWAWNWSGHQLRVERLSGKDPRRGGLGGATRPHRDRLAETGEARIDVYVPSEVRRMADELADGRGLPLRAVVATAIRHEYESESGTRVKRR